MTGQPLNNGQNRLPVPQTDANMNSVLASYSSSRGQATSQEQEGLNAAFYLWVFRRWWEIVVPAGLLLAGLVAALVFYFYVPKYQAKALILIEDQAPYIAFEERTANGRTAVERYLQTQVELLRSNIVLGPVLGRAEVASLPELSRERDRLEYLKERLTIEQVGKSELYEVSYVSPSAEAAADVANAVVAEYLDIQTNEDTLRSQRVIEILEEERRKRSDDVDRLRLEVTKLAKDVTGRDPFGHNALIEVDTALNPVSSLRHSLTEVDVDREVLKAEIQALRESPSLMTDHVDTAARLDLEIDSMADVRERLIVIDQIAAEMKDISTRGARINWQEDPLHLRLGRELELRKGELDSLRTTLRRKLATQRTEEQKQKNEQWITQLESELAKLNSKSKLLQARYNEHLEELKDGGAKRVEFEFARAELTRKENVFELIEARKLALQTELRAPARVRLRQKAPIPIISLQPVPYTLLLLFCTASLVLPFGLAIVHEKTARRVKNAEQLHQESNTRLLGEVARIPLRGVAASARALPRRLRREMTIFAESISTLR